MMVREIIAETQVCEVGKRYMADWDRLQPDGSIVTHRNVPFVVLREVTREDYMAAHPNVPDGVPHGYLFYEVSLD